MRSIKTIHLVLYGYLLIGMHIPFAYAESPDAPSNAEILMRLNRIEQQFQNQGLIDMLQQLEHLQHEVNRLQGVIEQQNHTIEQLQSRQRALYSDIDQRIQNMAAGGKSGDTGAEPPPAATPPLQTLSPVMIEDGPASAQQGESSLTVETITDEPTQANPPPAAAAAPETVATGTPAPTTDPVQIQDAYQQAFRLLKESQYNKAIDAFRDFLKANPDSEYSDNAQYWLGETYFVTHDFKQALAEYDTLINNYPESRKVPHALLKKGYSYYELGQTEEAKNQLEQLRQRFPGTTAARLAKERLRSLSASQPDTEN